MVKKVNTPKKSQEEAPVVAAPAGKKAPVVAPAVEDSIENVKEVDIDGDESQTIKQKKENAKKMLQSVKKFNAKLKSSLERKQIIKAVQALKTYQAKKKADKAAATKNLLEAEDQSIQVTFTLTQVPTRPTPRPLEIKVPHPFQGETKDDTRVCMFVKDPARDIKDQLAELKVPAIAKVIGISKLRKNFKQFKDKRKLMNDYDMFLADLRVYKMLPEALGKEFYQKKKYPCPLKLHGFTDPKDL
jgi:ribosome biogenesis protein UTP30